MVSLRVQLRKFRFQGKITNEEYETLIKKLDGHDAQIRIDERAKAFDECIQIVTEFCGGLPNSKLISALEHSKEQK